jgi:L-ascorbate metabolism protein UlaG (beta-lactamase superfamily)
MVGHASVLIQVAGQNILVDPVWSERASPVAFAGPKRVTAPGIAFDDLPPIDLVLISHSHYDHLDTTTLDMLRSRRRPRIITALGTDAVIALASPGARAEAGDWGDRFSIADDVAVTLHPAYHWSARRLWDRRMALWCGFVIEARGQVIYLAGDTGYGDGAIFRLVRERFGAPLVAILPIGAYEPRWFMRDQHVNPDEAVRIMLDCGARQALGVHWGTLQLTDEARLAPVAALEQACFDHGIDAGRFVPFHPGAVWPESS